MISNINIYYQNARGLRTKTNIFFSNMLLCSYDIICISETWLLPSIFNSELFDDRFSVYRCDRDYESRSDKKGGGILVAVRRGIGIGDVGVTSSSNLVSSDILSLSVLVKGRSKNYNLRLYCCYFPENNLQLKDEVAFYDQVTQSAIACPNDRFLIVGDFNIRNALWVLEEQNGQSVLKLAKRKTDPLVDALANFLSFNNFTQYNSIANSNDRQLDLVIGNIDCRVIRSAFQLEVRIPIILL